MVRLTAVVSALLAAIVLVLGGTGAANAAVAHGGFAGHIYVYDDAAHIACAPTRATDDRSPTPVQTVENNTSTRGDTWATRGGSTSHQGSRVAANAGRQTTILGENMGQRVIPFAEGTGARHLGFGATADEWAAMTPRQRWKLNDGMLRARVNEGDSFRYIGRDLDRPASVRTGFDLTGSELLR